MAEGAAKAVAAGHRCVKAKVGNGLDHDVAGVQAIREAIGPDVALRVDANMAWKTPKAAITAIHALEPYQIHSVEQPIPVGDLDALRRVRDAVSIPIMLDESVWGPHGAWDILRAGAADMLNVYVAESGGLTNSALIFRMAAFSMVPCAIGSMPELGIGTAAAVALGIAMPNLADYNDACGSTYQVHDVVNEQFDVDERRDPAVRDAGPGRDPGHGGDRALQVRWPLRILASADRLRRLGGASGLPTCAPPTGSTGPRSTAGGRPRSRGG